MIKEQRIEIAIKAVEKALGRELFGSEFEVVGSTYIKDRVDSDVDILVYEPLISLEEVFFEGWKYGGSVGMGDDSWMSWKRLVDGVEVNMLITDNQEYFLSWLKATEVCRFLHLQGYDIRSATVHGIHEIIMDESEAEYENKVRNY